MKSSFTLVFVCSVSLLMESKLLACACGGRRECSHTLQHRWPRWTVAHGHLLDLGSPITTHQPSSRFYGNRETQQVKAQNKQPNNYHATHLMHTHTLTCGKNGAMTWGDTSSSSSLSSLTLTITWEPLWCVRVCVCVGGGGGGGGGGREVEQTATNSYLVADKKTSALNQSGWLQVVDQRSYSTASHYCRYLASKLIIRSNSTVGRPLNHLNCL